MTSTCTIRWKNPDWTDEQRKAEVTRRINQWASRVLTNICSDPVRFAQFEQYQKEHPEQFVQITDVLDLGH